MDKNLFVVFASKKNDPKSQLVQVTADPLTAVLGAKALERNKQVGFSETKVLTPDIWDQLRVFDATIDAPGTEQQVQEAMTTASAIQELVAELESVEREQE